MRTGGDASGGRCVSWEGEVGNHQLPSLSEVQVQGVHTVLGQGRSRSSCEKARAQVFCVKKTVFSSDFHVMVIKVATFAVSFRSRSP